MARKWNHLFLCSSEHVIALCVSCWQRLRVVRGEMFFSNHFTQLLQQAFCGAYGLALQAVAQPQVEYLLLYHAAPVLGGIWY